MRRLCLNDSLSLSCSEDNQGLLIVSSYFQEVSWGSLHHYCSDHIKESEAELAECRHTSVIQRIVKFCHRQQNCTIKAEPASLGASECKALNVVLVLDYTCLKRENIRTTTSTTSTTTTTTTSTTSTTPSTPSTTPVTVIPRVYWAPPDYDTDYDVDYDSHYYHDKEDTTTTSTSINTGIIEPDKPPHNPDESRQHNFKVWKISSKFYVQNLD